MLLLTQSRNAYTCIRKPLFLHFFVASLVLSAQMQRQKRQPNPSKFSIRRHCFINYSNFNFLYSHPLISSICEIFLQYLLAIIVTTIIIIAAFYSTFAMYQALYIHLLISFFRSILLIGLQKEKMGNWENYVTCMGTHSW